MFQIIFFILFAVDLANSCGTIGGGGGILTNPSLSMRFHPPTQWTYPDQNALTALSYFPGQPLTQTEAQLRANGDMESAILAGLNALQLPTLGITVTPAYTPPLVNDCTKNQQFQSGTTPAGTQFGYEEGGAITKLITAPANTGVTYQNCISRAYAGPTPTTPLIMTEFIQQASIKIDGLTMSEYQLTLLAAKVSQYLMLNNRVDFVEEITLS
uniref:Uncharacterized protein n=1 Tax=Panagrolaimus davidi TaxID=227884 RepID=A0A914Q8V9_9BILA